MINHVSEGYAPYSLVRSSRESQCHRNTILKLACAYERAGFEVEADHVDDFPSPDRIALIMPDIVARKKDLCIVVEVETRSSIGTERDNMQKKVFGEWAKKEQRRDFRREKTI